MKITQTFTAPDRATWREWLVEHGASETEVWLVYSKAGRGKASIPYEDSLEEALCFGWVDSLIQKIDEENYARKFTPRKPGSQWSELNKHLLARAGFRVEQLYADYDKSPYGSKYPGELIFVAGKTIHE